MLSELDAGGLVRVEANPDQVDALCRIARKKKATICKSETSTDGRPVLTFKKG